MDSRKLRHGFFAIGQSHENVDTWHKDIGRDLI